MTLRNVRLERIFLWLIVGGGALCNWLAGQVFAGNIAGNVTALPWRYPYETIVNLESPWELAEYDTQQYVIPITTSYRKQFFITAKVMVNGGLPNCTDRCSLGFYFSIEHYNISEKYSGLQSGKYLAPKAVCEVQFNVTDNSSVTCFDFIRIPADLIAAVATAGRQGNLTVVGHVVGIGEHNFDLKAVNVSVHLDVLAVPYVFEKWKTSGVNLTKLECFWNEKVLYSNNSDMLTKFGKLMITDNGKSVQIEFGATSKLLRAEKSSMGYRIRSMQLGFFEAVRHTMKKLRLTGFPNITAIIFVGDEPHYSFRHSEDCDPGPILAQNRVFTVNNSFVVVPDFSYFTHFWDGHDHGSPSDRWFELIEREMLHAERKLFGRLAYGKTPFDVKKPAAIFRGRVSGRRFGHLRAAIVRCNLGSRLNATIHHYVNRVDMCNDFQAVISVPGNGVWSWATKYNMVGSRLL
jgi:hypothetical protein